MTNRDSRNKEDDQKFKGELSLDKLLNKSKHEYQIVGCIYMARFEDDHNQLYIITCAHDFHKALSFIDEDKKKMTIGLKDNVIIRVDQVDQDGNIFTVGYPDQLIFHQSYQYGAEDYNFLDMCILKINIDK